MTDKTQKCSVSFGEPVPVASSRIPDYLGVFAHNGRYYIPPVALSGLAAMRSASAHHGSAVFARKNFLANAFVKGPVPVDDFQKAAMDFFTFGNCYFRKVFNRSGTVSRLEHLPAFNMRKSVEEGYLWIDESLNETPFHPREVVSVREYDPIQNVYGIPDWYGGLQSILLNEEATLFRRKYYINGAHLGNIVYATDPEMSDEALSQISERLKQGKGIGNFRSVIIHVPEGKPDGLKLIPFGDIANKDEFDKIKSISAEDVLAAHRIPPVLMGILPKAAGGLGSISDAKNTYIETEVRAAARNFEALNDQIETREKFIFNTQTAQPEVK